MTLKHSNNSNVRNCGFGSRIPRFAALNACKNFYKSFSTANQVAARFNLFLLWAQNRNTKIRDVREITIDLFKEYVANIQSRVVNESLSVASAHNYVSAVNSVLKIMRGDKSIFVSTRFDTTIANRCYITTKNKAATTSNNSNINNRIDLLIRIQETLGLRFQESCKIDAKKALLQAEKASSVMITEGTKGSRKRIVPITNPEQIEALRIAVIYQGKHWSLIPPELEYIQFKAECYAIESDETFHANRHLNAQVRYRELVGVDCPVVVGIAHGLKHFQYISEQLDIDVSEVKRRDKNARLTLAEELGHSRTDITNNYLG